MANGFGDYPEIAEAASPRIDADSQPKQKKRGGKHKALKSLTKALKKHNKLLQEEQQRRDASQQQEDSIKKNNCRNTKSFLAKLGDAICKAVPAILTAFATAAIGCLFNRKPHIKNFQAG